MHICKIKHVHSVATTADARRLLLARPGQTGILAGGTSTIFSHKKELDTLVDLRPLQLNQIKTEEGGLCIGSMTCLTDLVFTDTVKDYADGILSRAAHRTGTTLNRNLCTLGGLLVHPYIWPETATAALALNAEFHIYRGTEEQVDATTFYEQAPAKSLPCGDIVTDISFPSQSASRRFAFEKYASTHNEFAWLTLAVGATLESGILHEV
ncbi:MAG: FAD binding domain-containing protein, partial [Kiritimatiellae bacterium]|nr:FAD binding domain-containing protein [Kiritimatiellia bacterium]